MGSFPQAVDNKEQILEHFRDGVFHSFRRG